MDSTTSSKETLTEIWSLYISAPQQDFVTRSSANLCKVVLDGHMKLRSAASNHGILLSATNLISRQCTNSGYRGKGFRDNIKLLQTAAAIGIKVLGAHTRQL